MVAGRAGVNHRPRPPCIKRLRPFDA